MTAPPPPSSSTSSSSTSSSTLPLSTTPLSTTPLLRSGYAALVGRPNAGKSTLLNALAGGKRSIVSRRAQTTRGVVRTAREADGARIILLDTPGWQDRRLDAFNRRLNRGAERAARDADVLVFTTAALSWTSADAKLLRRLPTDRPVLAAITKIDRVADKNELLPFIAELAERRNFAALLPVSGLRGDYVPELAREIARHLPPPRPTTTTTGAPGATTTGAGAPGATATGAPGATATGVAGETAVGVAGETAVGVAGETAVGDGAGDGVGGGVGGGVGDGVGGVGGVGWEGWEEGEMSLEFMLAECLREQLFGRLGAELPYGLGVVARCWEEGGLLRVAAEVLVERDAHKRMVIGRGGAALKRAAAAARREMEELVGRKIFLATRVKTRDWRANPRLLREMGVG